jgi:hypothetical protein
MRKVIHVNARCWIMEKLIVAVVLALAVIISAATASVDGGWEVRLPFGGGRGCNVDWMVRLTVAQGRLSGVFLGGAGTQTISNLVLKPDGSFAGTTSGGVAAGGSPLRVFSVSGQFSGNMATATATDTTGGCGTRTGQGTRISG